MSTNSKVRYNIFILLFAISSLAVMATPPLLRVKILSAGGATDETVLYLQPGASTSFDGDYDAYKLFGPSTSAQVWTYNDNTLFAINGMALPQDSVMMDLRLRINTAGSYTLQGISENGFNQQTNLRLYDKLTGQSYAFLNASQSFSLISSQDLDRFVLRVSNKVPSNCKPLTSFSIPDTIVKSQQVNLNTVNLCQNAVTYKWYFGDGSSSTQFQPSHAYSFAGTFSVTLKAASAGNCRDSLTKVLVVVNPGRRNISMQNQGNNRLEYSNLPQVTGDLNVQVISALNNSTTHRKMNRTSGSESDLDLSDVPQGLYYIIVTNRSEILHRATVLVR